MSGGFYPYSQGEVKNKGKERDDACVLITLLTQPSITESRLLL